MAVSEGGHLGLALLVAQGHQGIDARGAARGDVAGGERDGGEQEGDGPVETIGLRASDRSRQPQEGLAGGRVANLQT